MSKWSQNQSPAYLQKFSALACMRTAVAALALGLLAAVGCAHSGAIDSSTEGVSEGGSGPATAAHSESDHFAHMHRSPAQWEEQGTPEACDKTSSARPVAWSDDVSDDQIHVIEGLMKTRAHRTLHALWHGLRGDSPDSVKNDVTTLEAAFGPTWGESHPLCTPQTPNANENSPDYNPAGEDFLFMHRQMVHMVRAALIQANLPCIRPFKTVPTFSKSDGDNYWPAPDSDPKGPKSPQALARLQALEKNYFHNDDWLRRVSLSQLGWALEFTVHNNLHMRYATTEPPEGFADAVNKGGGGAPVPFDGKFPGDWPFDSASYNWLADPYGAAVNRTFWKIHGYVDDMIDHWIEANKTNPNRGYQKIAIECGGDGHCYKWRGTWTGAVSIPDAPTVRSIRGGGTSTGAVAAAPGAEAASPATIAATQRRMQHAHVGVFTDKMLRVRPKAGVSRSPVPAGPMGPEDGPDNPLVTVKAQLCSPQ